MQNERKQHTRVSFTPSRAITRPRASSIPRAGAQPHPRHDRGAPAPAPSAPSRARGARITIRATTERDAIARARRTMEIADISSGVGRFAVVKCGAHGARSWSPIHSAIGHVACMGGDWSMCGYTQVWMWGYIHRSRHSRGSRAFARAIRRRRRRRRRRRSIARATHFRVRRRIRARTDPSSVRTDDRARAREVREIGLRWRW